MPLKINCRCGGVIYEGDLAEPMAIMQDKNWKCRRCDRVYTPEELKKAVETIKINAVRNSKTSDFTEEEHRRRYRTNGKAPELLRDLGLWESGEGFEGW